MTKIKLADREFPKVINIGGVEYPLKIIKELRNSSDVLMIGNISYEDCYIALASQYNKQTIWIGLIHEIIHGICVAHDLEVKEEIVDLLAYGIYGCLVLTDWENTNDSNSDNSM